MRFGYSVSQNIHYIINKEKRDRFYDSAEGLVSINRLDINNRSRYICKEKDNMCHESNIVSRVVVKVQKDYSM